MNWNAYTVCSVISGLVLILVGLAARGVSPKDRLYAVVGGAIFGGYGLYVAKQTSGTFFFPVWIFIIPVVGIVYLVVTASGASRPRPTSPTREAAGSQPPNDSDNTAAAPASPVTPSTAPAPPERPAAWPPPPPGA
jgi:hypothetical protein